MAVFVILWLCCSVICYFIMKSKGYPNNECLSQGVMGFFFGLIWVVVDLCKKDYASYPGVSPNMMAEPNTSNNQMNYSYQKPNGEMPVIEKNAPLEDAVVVLERIAKLKSDGVLSEEEYQQLKSELLKRI